MASDAVRTALVRRIDLVGEASAVTPLEASGRCYRGFCPHHDDTTASLYVDPERREFACFGCGLRGDVVDLVVAYEGVDEDEAARRLAERIGVDVAALESDSTDGDVTPAATIDAVPPAAAVLAGPGAAAGLSREHATAVAAQLGIPVDQLLAAMTATAPVANETTTSTPTETPGVAPVSRASRQAPRAIREGHDDVERILAEDNLFLAWQKHRAFAQSHDVYFDSQMFRLYDRHVEENLFVLRARLQHHVDAGDFYEPAPFRKLRLTKPKGGVRDITILSQVEDGIVIQAILNIVGPRIEKSFSTNSYGHRLAHDFAQSEHVFERWQELWGRYRKKLQRFLWTPSDHAYVKGDLTAFYDRINRKRMRELIAGFVADDWVQGTVERYLDYKLVLDNGREEYSGPLGLPQGPAYGHFFANLYLDAFDRFVEGGVALDQEAAIEKDMAEWFAAFLPRRRREPKDPGAADAPDRLGYCRYVDDFFLLFPSRDAAEAGKERISEWLTNVGLELSAEKTTIHDATDLDPVVEEMKSRKYTLGKLLDNDESLSSSQREALFDVVENDYLQVAGADDMATAADNIGFVVGRLADTEYFDQNREALSNLVIELLFSESFKHSAMSGVLQRMLPGIIGAGLDTRFAEHLRRTETPDFKRVLFLQSVQENGFFDEAGPELQACVWEFTRSESYVVRFAAVTCLWANGITDSFRDIQQRIRNEPHPEIRGRLLHLIPDNSDGRSFPVLLGTYARDPEVDAIHGAVVAQRVNTEAAGRAIRSVPIGSSPSLVEWLYAIVRHGGRDALEALDRRLTDEHMASLVATVLRMIGSRAYTLAQVGFLDARSVLDLHENLPHLRHEVVQDVLCRDVLLPAAGHVARLETDEVTRAELIAIEASLSAADTDIDDSLKNAAESAAPENLGFLDDIGVSYRGFRDPTSDTIDIYETIDAGRITRSGAFTNVYAWATFLREARDKGLITYEEGRVERDGKRKAKRVRVHYRLPSGWRRLADLLASRLFSEADLAVIATNLARVYAGIEALARHRHRAPTLTPWSVVVDVSLNVRLINVGSAFCRPRYVSVSQHAHIEDGTASDSLFLGWLSFELLTGRCPVAEIKTLAARGGLRRYLTFSPALDEASLFYRRVLRRLTYESAEHRTSVRHPSIGRLLREYGQALEHVQTLVEAGVQDDVLASLTLLHFWSQRLSDTWSNRQLARMHHDRRVAYSFQRVMEDTAHFANVRGLRLLDDAIGAADTPAALHRGTEGLLRLVRRVEAMQATHVDRTGQTPDLRWNLVLLYLALRLELLALCHAVRSADFEAWKAGEEAERFRNATNKARFLFNRLGEILGAPPDGQGLLPQLESLASDLTILLKARASSHTPFAGTGLAGLAAFVTLLHGTDEDGAPMTGLLRDMSEWERDVVPHLAVRKPLAPDDYRELGLRLDALLAAAGVTRVGGQRHRGVVDENLLPLTTRKVPVHVSDGCATFDVDAGLVLALLDEPFQRSVAKDEAVTFDVVEGAVTAVSVLGPHLTELSRPVASVVEAAPAAAAKPQRPYQFYRNGDFWRLVFNGKEAPLLKPLDGFAYISVLLRHPGEPIHVLQLVAELQKLDGDPSVVIDQTAEGQKDSDHLAIGRLEQHVTELRNPDDPLPSIFQETRDKIEEYKERIERARAAYDEELAERLEDEKKPLVSFFRKNYDAKGNPRGDRPATENARSNITKQITRALKHLKTEAAAAYDHLKKPTITTGTTCTYHPLPGIDWQTSPHK